MITYFEQFHENNVHIKQNHYLLLKFKTIYLCLITYDHREVNIKKLFVNCNMT